MQAANGKPQETVLFYLFSISLINEFVLYKPHLQEHAFLLDKPDKDQLAHENEAFLWLVENLARDYSSQSQNCLRRWIPTTLKLTCSWVFHDLVDYKTLQLQLKAVHSVAVVRVDVAWKDLMVCSPHLITV